MSCARFLFFLLIIPSCAMARTHVDPAYAIEGPLFFEHSLQPQEVNALKSPFPPLSDEEKKTNSGRELICGIGFLKEGDLFQAICTLKRAQIFAKDEGSGRLLQIEYSLILAHFLAQHPKDIMSTFTKSRWALSKNAQNRPKELLLALYDANLRLSKDQEAQAIVTSLKAISPRTAKKMTHYKHFSHCELDHIPESVRKAYLEKAKSPQRAAFLNAIFPGAGYAYVGQTTTAFTSFMMNALFIAATYEFFHAGQPAVGIISAGFECGWYVGGIYGAHIAAKEHNKVVYMQLAQNSLHAGKLFPLLQFDYGF